MKGVSLFLLSIALVSCYNNNTTTTYEDYKANYLKELEELYNRQDKNDTIILGYILGKPTKSITDSLIQKGILSPRKTKKVLYETTIRDNHIPSSLMGDDAISRNEISTESREYVAYGYFFNFYVDSCCYNAILSLEEKNNNLVEAQVYLYNEHKKLSPDEIKEIEDYYKKKEQGIGETHYTYINSEGVQMDLSHVREKLLEREKNRRLHPETQGTYLRDINCLENNLMSIYGYYNPLSDYPKLNQWEPKRFFNVYYYDAQNDIRHGNTVERNGVLSWTFSRKKISLELFYRCTESSQRVSFGRLVYTDIGLINEEKSIKEMEEKAKREQEKRENKEKSKNIRL